MIPKSITLSDTHRPSLLNLLNSNFRVGRGNSFFDDFPVWGLSRVSQVTFKGILDANSQVIASAACRVAYLKRSSAQVKVAIIGAVATDAAHQGKGYASHLVGELLVLARAQKCEAAFLWGSEHSLYGKLGFELSGDQLRIPVSLFASEPPPKPESGFNPEIIRLISSRKDGLVIDHLGVQVLPQHRNVQWRWIRQGNDFAFAGFNRGIDLSGIVHEWGGDLKLLRQLFSALWVENKELQIFMHPSHLNEYGLKSDSSGVVYEKLVLCCPLSENFKWKEPTWFWGLDSG
jgi:GNAT superfamily N-acetyltransferase